MKGRPQEAGDCARVRSLIDGMEESRLKKISRLRVRRHVGSCPDCAGYLQRSTDVRRALESMDRLAAPDELADAIMLQLEGVSPAHEEERRRAFGRRRATLIAAGAGVVLAVSLAVIRLVFGRQAETEVALANGA